MKGNPEERAVQLGEYITETGATVRSAAKALPPLPTSMASAMNTIMMGLATVAAERPISPMACPKKMESMTL